MKENEFFVKTEFLDAEGEVLQEYNNSLYANFNPPVLHTYLSLETLTRQFSGTAKFDVPEDIKNTKLVRHTIIVKKKK